MTAEPTPGQQIRPEHIRRWGPKWSRRVGQVLAFGIWNTKVIGAKNLPAEGRVIVAANHTGIIDGPLLHGALPRGSHFIIKEEAFTGIIGFLMRGDRKSTRLNSSHVAISYAVFCLKKKK